MTLKEKFDWYLSGGEKCQESEECATIADEFAIGFAKWLAIHCYRTTDGNYWLTQNKGDFRKNSEEVLEIYKKEKGL
jgi:hypothetical protein